MSIRFKIIFAAMALVGCFTVLGIAFHAGQHRFDEMAHANLNRFGDIIDNIYNNPFRNAKDMGLIQLDLARFMATSQGDGTIGSDQNAQAKFQKISDDLDVVIAHTSDSVQRKLWNDIRSKLTSLRPTNSTAIKFADIEEIHHDLDKLADRVALDASIYRNETNLLINSVSEQLMLFMADSHRNLILSIIAILLVAALACRFLIKAIFSPLKKALFLANSLEIGYFDNKVSTDLKDEMGDLLRALATMQIELTDKSLRYEQQVQETETAYFKLESRTKELDEANAQLEALNTSTGIMLDALDQGLFYFGPDGVCSDISSKACLLFLGKKPSGLHISEVLRLSYEERSMIDRLLKLAFASGNPLSSFEDFSSLLPQKFTHQEGKAISLNYLPITNRQKELQSILVIATDRTMEEIASRLVREREKEALLIIRISGNRNLFTLFFKSITHYFSSLEESFSPQTSLEKVRRQLHTFKGNAAIFYLQSIVDVLHEMESMLADAKNIDQAREKIRGLMPQLKTALDFMHQQACNIFGKDFDQQGTTRVIPLNVLTDIGAQVKQANTADNLYKKYVETLIGESIHKTLLTFEIGMQELAERCGKKVSPCCYSGEDFQIFTEMYDPLFATFSHIYRNVVSHAIEAPEIRKEQGKTPEITITIDTQKFMRDSHEWFRISFKDDGCGIDISRLRKKLRATEQASDAEIMAYIFADSISTKDTVDALAGRGVGLSAIKHEAERLGGHVWVESERHLYTKISIEAPLLWA
ncbi:MAG: ATP-binding protein [Alphaproteobacteria bacterium]|nr:ATP-binding protein [Alphaproteobacteria bacterium]